jgi:hypothetical protein
VKQHEDKKTYEGEESRKAVNTKRRRIKKGIEEEEKIFVVHTLCVYNEAEKKTNLTKKEKGKKYLGQKRKVSQKKQTV